MVVVASIKASSGVRVVHHQVTEALTLKKKVVEKESRWLASVKVVTINHIGDQVGDENAVTE